MKASGPAGTLLGVSLRTPPAARRGRRQREGAGPEEIVSAAFSAAENQAGRSPSRFGPFPRHSKRTPQARRRGAQGVIDADWARRAVPIEAVPVKAMPMNKGSPQKPT